MRWSSLFLACQHLNSRSNLRECENQSWFQGPSGIVRCFRLPRVYAYPRQKTAVLDQCASDWFIVHKLTRSTITNGGVSLTFFREKSVTFSFIAVFTRGKILLTKLCKILPIETTVRRWNCECVCHTAREHGGPIALGNNCCDPQFDRQWSRLPEPLRPEGPWEFGGSIAVGSRLLRPTVW
jgi:hypothetical protein